MELIKNCRIHCISEALSPITHMMGTSGNEAVINREKILYKGKIHDVPVLSGNAIRHRMIRDPGAFYIIKNCGLIGQLNIDQANYLFNGGSLVDSSTNENLKQITEMQTLLPLYRLLGGSLRNQVIGGSLFVLRGILICEENKNQIIKQLPEGYEFPEVTLKSCEEFIDHYQYTRGDASRKKEAPILITEKDLTNKSNLMIYNGQNVIAGSKFYHGFILQNISSLEIGALLHSLQQWESSGSTIGGQGRIGHGILKMSIFFQNGEDFMGNELNPPECVAQYIEHIQKNKEKITKWLTDVFPNKTKPVKKLIDEALESC